MARVAKLETEARWYAPSIDNNRDDPDPFKVKLAPLTAREWAALQREAFSGNITQGASILEKAESMKERAIKRCVLDVYGYSVQGRDGVITPRNGEELIDAVYRGPAGEAEVLDDIFLALQNASTLEAGLVGKSSGPSDSSTPQTSGNGIGGAASADVKSAQSQTCQSVSGEKSETATTSQTPAPTTNGSQTIPLQSVYGLS